MCRKRQSGFALVAIAALLIVASMGAATVMLSRNREAVWQPKVDVHAQLADISRYIISFQRENHRLPCPADPAQPPDSINYGIEQPNCNMNSTGIRVGVLPIRTLGLPSALASDPWGTRLTYVIVEGLSSPYKFEEPYTGITIKNGSGATVRGDAAFAVISHGAKAQGGYSAKTGTLVGACSTADGLDQENCNGNSIFVDAIFNTQSASTFYDDAIVYDAVDETAKTMHRPCYPPRPPTPVTWGAACSSPYTNMLDGDPAQHLNNTTPEYSGSTDVTCNNGVLSQSSPVCTYTPSCPASTENWVGTVSGCTAARGALTHGSSITVSNSTSGMNGSVTATCNSGVISLSGASCDGNSCNLPWGGTLAHGGTISAYQTSSVTCGNSCVSENRSCNLGNLSGSFANGNCTAASCSNCSLPWGGTLAHNSSVTAFSTASVPCGSSCTSQSRTCNNGTLSGSYSNQSCSAASCAACTLPWGGTIAHGASVTAYNASSVPCGNSCSGQTRTCNNGNLSGSYTNAACSVAACPANPCTLPWGDTIDDGQSVTAYESCFIAWWEINRDCQSETRTCNNGNLSGSYGCDSCYKEIRSMH
jgi:hypothetical protein